MYTQNQEERYFLDYFKGFKGTLLDLGANDGKTYSNSLKLIEIGWEATLVEASPTIFKKLKDLHKENEKVECLNIAIGTHNEHVVFYESGSLVSPHDYSLVSTIDPKELQRWPDMVFTKKQVECVDYSTLLDITENKDFDFISIDIEGMDYLVLTQINLKNVKMVCVEHNGKETQKYVDYCKRFGMRELHRNGENLLMIS